ncbi:MAG TPA: SDR family NAD(P)-dependent oxidoreductase [Bryobacteraceae bacterium]|nr:SDR family NAD(P)-dependent oxidoreductase [Bryobacteraceae bacterium]
MRFDGKTALVTGAAKGIGAGIAARFVEAGATVVIFDIDGAGARAMAEKLGVHGRALPIEGDVAKEDDVRRAIEMTAAELGRLDVLVNNAGIEVAGAIPEYTSAQWDRQVGVNLKGAFLCIKHAIPRMRGRGGAIVNISSVHAFASYPGNAAYDASKAGMLALTRTLALEHGRDGIRVNAICPGYIDTPMMDEWLATLPDPDGAMRQVLAAHPLGRIGTPRDIAAAVLFLASDEAAFISGATLVVDGGMTVAGH